MKKNKPNIISNELDQAPKTWKYYFERLQDPELKKQIIDAMSDEFIVWNDENEEINIEIKERLWVHEKELPLNFLINQLSNHKKVAYLYNKKSAFDGSEKSGFHKLVWPLAWIEYQAHKLWASFNKEGETLSEWEIWTFLTFERNEYGQIVIWAEQIEIPKGPFVMAWLAWYKKMELSEFLEFIKNEELKSVNKGAESGEMPDTADTESQEKDSWKKKKGRQRFFGKK